MDNRGMDAQAALDNVRAVAASSLQRSSARDVFARADVVLAWYTNGRDTHLVPLINEISLLNSASKLISFWNPHREPNHWPLQVSHTVVGSHVLQPRAPWMSGRATWPNPFFYWCSTSRILLLRAVDGSPSCHPWRFHLVHMSRLIMMAHERPSTAGHAVEMCIHPQLYGRRVSLSNRCSGRGLLQRSI